MAKFDLNLLIGSTFKGEGFQQANNALKTTTKAVRGAGRVISVLQSDIGKLDGKVAKATLGVTHLFQSFMTGGPIGLVIAGITTAVAGLVKAFQKAKEAAKNTAEYISNSFVKSIDKASEKLGKTRQAISNKNNIDQAQNDLLAVREQKALQEEMIKTREKYDNKIANEKDKNTRGKITAQRDADLKALDARGNIINAQSQVRSAGLEREQSANEYNAVLENINEIQATINKQRTENKATLDKYDMLNNRVKELDKQDSTYTEKEHKVYIDQAGRKREYDVERSKSDLLAEAIKKLNEFKKQGANDTVIKDYENSLKSLAEANKDLEQQDNKYEVALIKEKEAVEKLNIAQNEYAETLKDISEDLKKKMDKIDADNNKRQDKANKAQANADKKAKQDKLKKDQKEAQKDYDVKRKTYEKATKDVNPAEEAYNQAVQAARTPYVGPQSQGDANKDLEKQIRDEEKAARKQEFNQNKAARNAQKGMDKVFGKTWTLQGNLTNNPSVRNFSSLGDVADLAQNLDYTGFKGVGDEQIDSLQHYRDEMKGKLFDENGKLKAGVKKSDYRKFQKLDQSLRKQDEADKKGKELEEAKKKQTEAYDAMIQSKDFLKNIEGELVGQGVKI